MPVASVSWLWLPTPTKAVQLVDLHPPTLHSSTWPDSCMSLIVSFSPFPALARTVATHVYAAEFYPLFVWSLQSFLKRVFLLVPIGWCGCAFGRLRFRSSLSSALLWRLSRASKRRICLSERRPFGLKRFSLFSAGVGAQLLGLTR